MRSPASMQQKLNTGPTSAAYIDEVGARVPFRTKSDASIAAFALKHGDWIPFHVLDDLLNIFREPDFRAADVTFSKAEDIRIHVGDFRRALRDERTVVSVVKSNIAAIPDLILEHVAESLASERHSFASRSRRNAHYSPIDPPFEVCIAQESLLQMSLVHRSWTDAAQRALRHRITIVGQKGLRSFLLSPFMGPWIHNFTYRSFDTLHPYNQKEDVAEVSRLLTAVITKCPNIRQLCLRTSFASSAAKYSEYGSVIRLLSSLHSLQSLWLSNSPYYAGDQSKSVFLGLCDTLTKLKSLKDLHILSWSFPYTDSDGAFIDTTLPLSLQDLSPNPGLTTLTFHASTDERNAELIAWIMRPRGDYRLKILDLSLYSYNSPSDTGDPTFPLNDIISPALPFLQKLRLSTRIDGQASESRITSILAACSALLSLSLVLSGQTIMSSSLPTLESLERLHIHYPMRPIFIEEQDTRLKALIESLPSLRDVKVTRHPGAVHAPWVPPPNPWEPLPEVNLTFDESKAYCEERGLIFLFEDTELPAFEDIED